MNRIFGILTLVFSSIILMGQNFTVDGPSAVNLGENFQVTYTFKGARAKDFKGPQFTDFRYLNGPSNAVYQVNNDFTYQYTYTLHAPKIGSYFIPSASIKSGGKTYTTKPLKIKVIKNNGPKNSDKFLLRGHVSNRDIYFGEPVIYTLKLYIKEQARYDGNSYKEPSFTGFQKERVEDFQVKEQRQEYNGEIYTVTTLAKYVLFPTKTGELEIKNSQINIYNTVVVKERDFFTGRIVQRRRWNDVPITLNTPILKVNVKELPSSGKPTNFNGIVGNYKFGKETGISFTEVKVDDAINLNYIIEGSGNIDLLKLPELSFPPDFDMFDPELSQRKSITASGITGSKSFKYVLLPRTEGTFEIPALEFSFFDSKTESYKTIRSEGYTIKVGDGISKGDSKTGSGSYASKKQVHYVDKDIRFIHQNISVYDADEKHLLQKIITPLYFGLSPLLMIAFVFWRKKQSKDKEDVQLMRYKKANKLARKHLKNALQMIKSGQQAEFHIEISKVLWGYLSDKFTIPRSDLSINEIVEQLQNTSLDEENVQEIKAVLEQCEFARFAPAEDNKSNMQPIYDKSLNIISKIEKGIK